MLQTYYPKPSRKLFLPFTYPIVLDGFVRVDMCNNLLDCYNLILFHLFFQHGIFLSILNFIKSCRKRRTRAPRPAFSFVREGSPRSLYFPAHGGNTAIDGLGVHTGRPNFLTHLFWTSTWTPIHETRLDSLCSST